MFNSIENLIKVVYHIPSGCGKLHSLLFQKNFHYFILCFYIINFIFLDILDLIMVRLPICLPKHRITNKLKHINFLSY